MVLQAVINKNNLLKLYTSVVDILGCQVVENHLLNGLFDHLSSEKELQDMWIKIVL